MNKRQSEIMENFCNTFGPHLANTGRWGIFQWIALRLIERGRPIFIGETGCARDPGNWAGDGQSTLLWDWLLQAIGGAGFTVDKNVEAISELRKSMKRMIPVCEDSIRCLMFEPTVQSLDLLYLDSMDYDAPYGPSELHHAGELAVSYSRLPSGCLIAVDDCHSETMGKHVMVKQFFDRMGIKPRIVGYISVWEKP